MHIRLIATGAQGSLAAGEAQARFGSAERKLGPWASWDWDGGRLTARVDRFGLYPLFYARLPDGIALADSVAQLLRQGAPRAFDDAAIAAFLRLGFFIGEDTSFAAIRALPPGGQLDWSPGGGLRVTGAPVPREPDPGITWEAAVDGFVERFAAAVGRRLDRDPATTALTLSGGRDSRHIALESKKQGFQPGMVVSQRRGDDDADVAAELCRALDWPITVVPQTGDPVTAELEKNLLFDCLTDEHAWFLPTAHRLRAAGIRSVFDGLAGDVLSNALFIREHWFSAGRAGSLEKWLRCMPGWGYGAQEPALAGLLTPAYQRRWSWEAALSRVAVEFARYADDDNPFNPFMFWNRTRREIAPFHVRYLPGVEVLTPYLDDEVFDFLWRLPTELQLGKRLHDAAIARAAPAYAHIAYVGTAPATDPGGMNAAIMRGMARRLEFWRGGEILDRRWLRRRIVGSLLWPKAAKGASWYLPWPVWLASLERLAGSAG